MSRISLLHPGRFSADPARRRRIRASVVEIILIRLWAFAIMSGSVAGLCALGAELPVALSAVLALSASAAQLASLEPRARAVAADPAATPTVS
ncbi:hypothetical protein ACWIGW_45380 [Nocardia brasiliensis]